MQLGRSILLLLSTIFNFAALVYLPLADVSSIIFTAPIIVALLAVAVLRERVSLARWLAIGAGFAGALLIVRPGAGTLNLGALLAFGCALAYALYQVTTRSSARASRCVAALRRPGRHGRLQPAGPFWWQAPTPRVWLMFALIGALGAGGHLLVIMALQRAEASRVSPFSYVQLLWAMIASFLVFGDVPSPWTVLGGLVIAGSGLRLYRLGLREAAEAPVARDP
jgi:drug/metabolite transporter (DMT)-like permease